MFYTRINKTKIVLLLLSITLAIFGAIYVLHTWVVSKKEVSEQTLKIAKMSGAAINGEMIKQLSAEPEDMGTTAYESIKKRLIDLQIENKETRFIYLYTQKAGKLYFLADSEPIDSKDYSPPGQEYTEAANVYAKPFIDGQAIITKPETDRWGTWVSILVPIKDIETDGVRAVFAMDYPAADWNNKAFFLTMNAGVIVLVLYLLLFAVFIIVDRNYNIKKTLGELKERSKELNCLYEIGMIIGTTNISLEMMFQKIVNIIPSGWQYPDITCARIIIDNNEYKTVNYKKTEWKQTSDIVVHGKSVGCIEVFYLEEGYKIDIGERQFLKQEKKLIYSIAERLGHVVERIQAEKQLSSKTIFLETIIETFADGILIVDDSGRTIINNKHFVELWKIPQYIMDTHDDNKILEYVSKELKEPDKFSRKVAYLYEHKDEKSQDEIELVNGIILDRYSSPLCDTDGKCYGRVWFFRDITERKKSENLLRESNDKINLLMDSTAEAIYGVDINGNCTFCNRACLRILGYKQPEELIGKNMHWQIHSKHPDGTIFPIEECRIFKAFRSGEGMHADDEVLWRSDDTSFAAEYWSYPLFVDGVVVGAVVTFFDITERKHMENNLQVSNNNLSLFMKHSPIYAYIKEVTPISSRVIMASDNFQNMIGIPGSQMIGKTMDELFPAEIAAKMTADDWNTVSTGNVLELEESLNGRNYNTIKFPISQKGKNMIAGYTIDITERKIAENKIIGLKNRDEAILNSIGDAVFASDKDGKILLFNKMAEFISGVSTKEAIGNNYKQILRFIKESDGEPSNDWVAEAIKTGQATKMSNHTILITKSGRRIPVADSASPIKNSQGEIVGCVVVFRDVTHEMEVDKAKTEFVSLASHQLRTPLTAIRWYMEMLLSDKAEKDSIKRQRYLKEIYNSNQRMISLVSALLNVSRIDMGNLIVNPRPTNFIEISRNVINELSPTIKQKNLQFKEIYDPKLPLVPADATLLNIIFQNLFSNAVKYTQEGGKITVSINKDPINILIEVADNGYGIPINQQPEIFKKLFRADNTKTIDQDGTGLGLYIVKSILDASGGQIYFKSEENKGTTFYVTIPIKGMMAKSGTKGLQYFNLLD